ncbi:MAG: phosphatase PAP2 family protein [Pseudomonadota bacterium]|nr:phosphatase PAP2 family protein [Pseudomonadota bacterium]
MDHNRPAKTLVLPPRGWRISRRHALIAASSCWAGFAVIVALVLGNRLAAFDSAGLQYFRTGPNAVPWGPPALLEAVRDWTALGGVLLRNLFAAITIAALLLVRLRREATLLAATILSGWVVNTLIKATVGRPRPTIVSHLAEAGGSSFPSGHSFNSAVVYMGIALALASLSAQRGVRRSMITGAALVTALIAVSRVWLGVHYPSDVLAGWLGGMGWALTASALLYRPARELADAAAPAIEAATPGELQS